MLLPWFILLTWLLNNKSLIFIQLFQTLGFRYTFEKFRLLLCMRACVRMICLVYFLYAFPLLCVCVFVCRYINQSLSDGALRLGQSILSAASLCFSFLLFCSPFHASHFSASFRLPVHQFLRPNIVICKYNNLITLYKCSISVGKRLKFSFSPHIFGERSNFMDP